MIQGFITELRRGTLTLAVLSCLSGAQYGYSLLQEIEGKGVRIEANTLYPLLRRLESQGLLESAWDTGQSRPRKYYRLNNKGVAILERLKEEWRRMSREMDKILREDGTWSN
ncbi:MAG: PadR family transcriptional regulator [Clostridiales bacterium]|nr:PadR family transcriptional regulator [Clostridiales bacterium]